MSEDHESQSEKNFVTPKDVPDYLVRQVVPEEGEETTKQPLRDLTRKEQRILAKALRRSTRLIAPGE